MEQSVITVKMEERKDLVKLQKDKLNIAEIVDLVLSSKCGAVSTFIGITRDNFEDKKVTRLEYEAYEPMALKEMRSICSKLRSQWNVEHIAMHHRLGIVPVTEASVIIAISSPHRQESLQAVQFAIDMLKSSVPIWKKEIYDTEESQWKENKECAWSTSERQGNCSEDKDMSTTKVSFESNSTLENIQVVASECRQNENSGDSMKEPEYSETIIDSNLVQIRASTEELNRRIESFISRKRQQVNIVNVQEFCCHRARNEDMESSCARVDAILIRRKDSKSHVKVHRVLNPWGPQTVDATPMYKSSGNVAGQSSPNSYPSALEERFSTSEKLLGVNGPVPRDVYKRLKNIEDKILYLESLSPEYRHFWVTEDDSFQNSYKPVRKRTFSTAELDTKLHELEDRYVKRIK